MQLTIPAQPLILTLRLDATAQQHFDALRQRYFPASRNYLAAHLTLFHAIPDAQREHLERSIRHECQTRNAITLEVTALRFLGQGVAFVIQSRELSTLRDALAEEFREHLTPQDSQAFRPHITVQNKVSPADAKATFAKLNNRFTSFQCQGKGIDLWQYDGGPWRGIQQFRFSADPSLDAFLTAR